MLLTHYIIRYVSYILHYMLVTVYVSHMLQDMTRPIVYQLHVYVRLTY
jgi:hypothetical protein